jgi:hypothetical protein
MVLSGIRLCWDRGLRTGCSGVGCGLWQHSHATIGIYRLRKERLLLRDYETVAATVSQWTKADGPDGGYVYSVRYRFLGSDGKVYYGKSGTTDKELSSEGNTVPVLYKRTDPSQNEALATFWFHRFTYTGTE